MDYFILGEVVREARKRCGLTQEELAFGICSVSTLSKIENGIRIPRNRTFEALMERMGETYDHFRFYEEKRELKRRKLLNKMTQAARGWDMVRLEILLKQYKAIAGEQSILEQQEQIMMEAALCLWKNEAPEYICRALKKALELTGVDCDGIRRGQAGYTYKERSLLLMLACCYRKMGQLAYAEKMLLSILRYLNRKPDEGETFEYILLPLYYELATLYFQTGRYVRSERFCTRAIRLCLQKDRYFLSALLRQKMIVLAELGDAVKYREAERNSRLFDEIFIPQERS